jgi:hypothetical protein
MTMRRGRRWMSMMRRLLRRRLALVVAGVVVGDRVEGLGTVVVLVGGEEVGAVVVVVGGVDAVVAVGYSLVGEGWMGRRGMARPVVGLASRAAGGGESITSRIDLAGGVET